MSIPDFNVLDRATWKDVLEPEHIAAIYGRTVLALKKACQTQKFTPAPYKTKPYRWRKVDVLRDIEGGRAVMTNMRRVG